MKKKRLSREFKIGAFSIAMLALLYFSINFIKSNRIFSNDQTFYAVFQSADGLEASAPIMAKGFRIGTVEKVAFNLEQQDIIVTLNIQKEYPIAVGSKVKITSSGIMGGQIVELSFTQNSQKYNNKDTLQSVFEPSLMQMVGMEYSTIKDKLSIYADKLDKAFDGINGVLSPENVANLNATMVNLNTITGDLGGIVASKKKTIESVISNLESLSSSLKEIMPKVHKTIDNLAVASDSFPPLLVDANLAISNLSGLLAKISKGDGNLGKLISNEDLYDNLAATVTSMNALLSDLKENPKRYVNITVFGKKTYEEKMADKEARKLEKLDKSLKK